MNTAFLNLPRLHKQLIAATFDCISLPLLFYIALALHFDAMPPGKFFEYLWLEMGAALIAIPVFIRLGMYRAVIRYIDQQIIIAAFRCATATVVLLGSAFYLSGHREISITPFLIFWALCILYILASRFSARRLLNARRAGNKVRVAIYGAGDAGRLLAHAILPGEEYLPVLFVDDNPQRVNTTIGGINVHAASDLEQLAKKHKISTVLLAMPSITRPRQREIFDKLAGLSLIIKVTPPVSSIVTGKARVEDVRQVEIEDLLSRDVVSPNVGLLSICVTDKSVLVSGAGGSIGSELCRQIVALHPSRLVLLETSEYALYSIEQELRETIATLDLKMELITFLGSVLETEKCTRLMRCFAVETVYHAAAYKHVPLVEHNPIAGIRNNAFGTLSLAEAAATAKVKNFVLISTDKAVRPTNVMGATKRLAELILQAFARRGTQTKFCMVRFGNVLGSSGSVVPLFRKQIAAGGPLTLTHPDITRYFMTIPEAAQLVIQAGAMGKGGDVFVLDMGNPVRIADLAVRMVHLSGQEVKTPETPHGTIAIDYVGLRPGEKLYEELLIGSNVTRTEHPLIQRAKEAEFEWPVLNQMLQQLDDACDRYDHNAIRLHMQKLVREYVPSSDIADHVWINQAQLADEAAMAAEPMVASCNPMLVSTKVVQLTA
jgi:FlaA1/EpsC-like NDP-sugar epimerase